MAIGLMQALPTALVQTQRDREEELIFRGEQYRRAVQMYVRKFGRYPNSLDDLEETNGVRFLRRRYRDPVTGEEEWRMIHIGPGGTFPDSKNSITPLRSPAAQDSPRRRRVPSRADSGSSPLNLRRPPFSAGLPLRRKLDPRPSAALDSGQNPSNPPLRCVPLPTLLPIPRSSLALPAPRSSLALSPSAAAASRA